MIFINIIIDYGQQPRKIDGEESINRVGVLHFTLGFFLPNPAQASIASCQIKTETDDRLRFCCPWLASLLYYLLLML
jgi:hypothetical protein